MEPKSLVFDKRWSKKDGGISLNNKIPDTPSFCSFTLIRVSMDLLNTHESLPANQMLGNGGCPNITEL